MAEPLHHSSDVPNFDAYPAPLPGEEEGRQTGQSSGLEEKAALLGSKVGKAVVAIRNAQGRLKDLSSRKSAELGDTGERAAAGVGDLTHQAGVRAEEWSRLLRGRILELRRQARTGARRAGIRAREIAHDYPVQVAVGAGVLGVVVGAGLRIWRGNRG